MAPKTRQLELPSDEEPESRTPLVYVASALTHLDEQGHLLVDAWCHIIQAGVTDAVRDATQPWACRVHLPVTWSAPGSPGEPDEIYSMNSKKVREEADALVVIGYQGGSLGAGQEFAWATSLRMPILFLKLSEQKMSRQIEGTPADVQIHEYSSSEELEEIVRQFIRTNRRVIEDNHRRRENRITLFRPLGEALRVEWEQTPPDKQSLVAAEARLHKRRIGELVGDPVALAGASLDEVTALAGALGTSLGRWLAAASLPDLDSRQLGALRTASTEYEWDASETLDLLQAARIEMAKGGHRRLAFGSPEDWATFRVSRQL